MLGYEVRKKGAPHNCLDDACAAMKLVLAKIEHGVEIFFPLVQEDVSLDVKLLSFQILINVILADSYLLCYIIYRYLNLKWRSYFSTEYPTMCLLKNYIKSFLGILQLKSRLSVYCWYLDFNCNHSLEI